MTTKSFWVRLLEKYWLGETIINHSIWVSQIVYEIAIKINSKASKELVNANKVYLA